MTLFWTSIVVGVVVVALAIGIPFLISHRRLRPHDVSGSQEYLQARDEAAENVTAGPVAGRQNICRECGGTGRAGGDTCPACHGTGKVADQLGGV